MHREVSIWDIVLAGLLAVVVVLAAIGFVSHERTLDEYRRQINWQAEIIDQHSLALNDHADTFNELKDVVNNNADGSEQNWLAILEIRDRIDVIVDFLNQ